MHFVDEARLLVEAGDGGKGAIAFHRGRFEPFGGPAGGDGGLGGDVIFEGDGGMSTLSDLVHATAIRAERGQDGMGKDCYGRGGKDVTVKVPLGTIAYDEETGEKLFEVVAHKERVVAAKGGLGGLGNKHFATSVDRSPRRAQPGLQGDKKRLRLELKVMADVGLLGFPNVGKSTFVRAVSAARPKVADYPFTTLEPHLGVVTFGDARREGRSFVIADIPGLVEGASEGIGLGHRFLRHVERTRLLLHLVTLHDEPDRTPLGDYDVIRRELERYSPELALRKEIVALTKADLPHVQEAYDELKAAFAERGVELHLVSAASHDGLDALVSRLSYTLGDIKKAALEAAEAAAPSVPEKAARAPRRVDEGDAVEGPEVDDGDGETGEDDGD
jgi:GTP-binding protein